MEPVSSKRFSSSQTPRRLTSSVISLRSISSCKFIVRPIFARSSLAQRCKHLPHLDGLDGGGRRPRSRGRRLTGVEPSRHPPRRLLRVEHHDGDASTCARREPVGRYCSALAG